VGKFKPVTLLLVLALVAAGWWMYTFMPIYLDHLEMREATQQIINTIPAVGLTAEPGKDVLYRINAQIGWHLEVDEETGVEREVPGMNITREDNLVINYDQAAKRVTVTIEYDRVVLLKPFNKRRTLHFVASTSDKLQ
jgi:hypothetical protein